MIRHQISKELGMPSIYEECSYLRNLPNADHYQLDVSLMQHLEPFSMLLLGSAIRSLKNRNAGEVLVEIVGKDGAKKQGHRYAERMGFWWSIGDSVGRPRSSQNPEGSTIPISKLEYSDLFRRSGGVDPVRSGAVSRAAAQVATALCGTEEQTPLWNAMEYSFREMFRNTFEHSRSDSVWFVASSRPQMDDVQIALLDDGIGIKRSLEESRIYSPKTCADAIGLAMRPGVSRNSGKKRTPDEEQRLREQFPGQDPTEWDNSGYGLTLATDLCRHAGQFTVASGDASFSYVGASVESFACHEGTAVRFVLYPSRVEAALERVGLSIKQIRPGRSSQSLMSASQRLRLRDP